MLHRMLLNQGATREEVHCLYMGFVRWTIVLYTAPAGSSRCKAHLRSLQRLMAIRGYRKISYKGATILAQFPPCDILAEMETMVYNQICSVGRNGEETLPDHDPEMLPKNLNTQVLRAPVLCQPMRCWSRSAEL